MNHSNLQNFKKDLNYMLLIAFLLVGTLFSLSADTKPIRVGWVLRSGMTEVKDGVYSGLNYDYLMEIAKYTGWSYEFVVAEFPTCTQMLKNGEIDILGTLLYSDARAESFDYIRQPYSERYVSLFSTESSTLRPYDFESYPQLVIAFLRGDHDTRKRLAEFAGDVGFTYTLAEYSDVESLRDALDTGSVDAAVLDAYHLQVGYKLLAQFSPVPYYFATTKGNFDVKHGLNRALGQLTIDRPTFKQELYEKYNDIVFNRTLTSFEYRIVSATNENPLVIGVVDSGNTVCFWNESKKSYDGIAIRMFNKVAAELGLNFVYTDINMDRRNEAMHPIAGSPDLVLGVTVLKGLADSRNWNLSDVLFDDSLVLVKRKNSPLMQSNSKTKIAIMKGFAMARTYVEKTLADFSIIEYETMQDCIEAVRSNDADTAIYLSSCVNYLLQNSRYKNLEKIQPYGADMGICVAGFTDKSKTLIGIINKGIKMLSNDERQQLVLSYTTTNYYPIKMNDIMQEYLVSLIFVLFFLLGTIALFAALFAIKRRNAEKLEIAYEQEKAALKVAERASAAKGNFMSRISHEIRTPLNAVIGYNTIARTELNDAKTEVERRQADMKVMDCLTKSDVASMHLLTIINDVLDMSAIESGKIKVARERFDFKGLITSLTAIFYSQSKKKDVEFEVIFDTLTEEWFVGDQMRVSQVLTNLLSNAIKFTPENGKVTLSIRQPEAEKNAAHIHFEVTDTGIGMTEEYLTHIWTPFEQADSTISRRFGGTGLGLAITKSLVDLMHGTISVKSSPGCGSTFSVDLTFERTEQPRNAATYDFSTINALVVDDEPSTCDYIKLLFNRFGARCATVTSGEEALHAVCAAEDSDEHYTLCLVDWRMPRMDGIETVKGIRSLVGDDVPIIVITAYDFSEISEKAAEVGVNMFIAKPLFQSSLFDLLANICGRQSEKAIEPSIEYDFSGAHILLAEDNEMNMEVAHTILEAAGFLVDSAWNGQEAVALFESAPAGTYKAILMDVQMPVMDGHAATKAIRKSNHPDAATIPILAMTADAFAENEVEALNAGMNAHISKPIDLTVLFETLKRYL